MYDCMVCGSVLFSVSKVALGAIVEIQAHEQAEASTNRK